MQTIWKGEKNDERQRRRKKGWRVGRMEKWLPFRLVVVQNFGVTGAASGYVQNRKRKLEETRWEKEMVENSLAERKDRGKFRER